MKGYLFGVLLLLLVVQPVSAEISRVTLAQEEELITVVPFTNYPEDRFVDLLFRTEPFSQGRIDASGMLDEFSDAQSNMFIDISECEIEGESMTCTIPNLRLATSDTTIEFVFFLTRNGQEVREEYTLTMIRDATGPYISSFKINECEGECYVSPGRNQFYVGMHDDDGIPLSLAPMSVGNRNIFPSYCEAGICYYTIDSLDCSDGQNIGILLDGDNVRDSLGNTLGEDYRVQTTCDSLPPEIIEEPTILNPGPQGQLVEGNDAKFFLEVKDTSRVTVTVDFTGMDGFAEEAECVFDTGNFQKCLVTATVPPGPQEGNAQIKIIDGAGNVVEREVRVSVLQADANYVPHVTVRSVSGPSEVSRMLLAGASARGEDFSIGIPISFTLDSDIGYIGRVEIRNCAGTIQQNARLASDEMINNRNRIDIEVNPRFSDNDGLINCTLEAFVRTDNTFFRTPARVSIVHEISLTGTDFKNPGERVIEKLEEERERITELASWVEGLNNIVPKLRKICSINQALNTGEQVGAAVEAVGLGIEWLDEGALLTASEKFVDTIFKVQAVFGTYGDDKQSKETSQWLQDTGNEANKYTKPRKNAKSIIGGFKAACAYITCEKAQQDRAGSFADAGFSSIPGVAWDQLSQPNVRDNLFYAIEQQCYPAVVAKLNDIGQYYCAETVCLKSVASFGGDLSSCEGISSEGICREVVGAGTEAAAYSLSKVHPRAAGALYAIKNLKDRFSQVVISAALGVAKNTLIEGVTGNCESFERRGWAGERHAKVIGCHITYAVRLFIESYEQAEFYEEAYGTTANMCELAQCEGNACAGVIPTRSNVDAGDIFIHREPFDTSNVAEQRVYYDFDANNIGSGPLGILGGVSNLRPANDYVSLGEINGKQYWATEEVKEQLTSTLDPGAEFLITPETAEYFKRESQKQNKGLESGLIALPDGIDPNKLAPYDAVYGKQGPSGSDGVLIDENGNAYMFNPKGGKYEKVYNPNDPSVLMNWYRQVGASFANRWFEENVVVGMEQWLDKRLDRVDIYSRFEDQFCSVWGNLDERSDASIMEPTDTGWQIFNFNAERSELGNNYIYTLVFFMQGFDDETDGYEFDILLKGGNPDRLVGKGKIMPGQIFRPDGAGDFTSIRSFNLTQKYDNLCFKFTPKIREGTLFGEGRREFCQSLTSGFSGLGDPYNPQSGRIRSGRTNTGIDNGGMQWP